MESCDHRRVAHRDYRFGSADLLTALLSRSWPPLRDRSRKLTRQILGVIFRCPGLSGRRGKISFTISEYSFIGQTILWWTIISFILLLIFVVVKNKVNILCIKSPSCLIWLCLQWFFGIALRTFRVQRWAVPVSRVSDRLAVATQTKLYSQNSDI